MKYEFKYFSKREKTRRCHCWPRKYIEQLFCENRFECSQMYYESGWSILTQKVQAALNTWRRAKPQVLIIIEFLKLLDENSVKWLTIMFSDMYNSGNIPCKQFKLWNLRYFISSEVMWWLQNITSCATFWIV